VAGWAHFCNSRARPPSNGLRGVSPKFIPATGCDSEAVRFLKGTFKARTSKRKFFSQFSVFRFRLRRNGRGFRAEDHTVARARFERVRLQAAPPITWPSGPGLYPEASSPSAVRRSSPCGKVVEILCGARVDRVFRGTVWLKGFEDSQILTRVCLD
jgi:hypothetical protein